MSTERMAREAAVTVVAHDVGPVGGMERMLTELVNRLLDRGTDVTLVSRSCELPSHPRLRWIRVPGPARPFTFAFPWFLLAGSVMAWRHRRGPLHTTGALVLNRADLSTVHFCHYGARERMRLLRAARPHPHYRLNAWLATGLSRAAERWCYRPTRTRCLVAVSSGVGEELREHFPSMAEATRVISNGVDRAEFRPNPEARARIRKELGLEESDLVAIFVGSEWEGKGVRFLVEAVGRARDWHLLVVGRGDEARYRRLADKLAPGRVHFVGEKRNIACYYASADAFALPSAYESFSMSAHEAAACGLPLLITPVSGAEDLLVDGENGWFIERDTDVISDRLGRLGADPALRRRMAQGAREATRNMSWEEAVDAYSALYRDLEPG